MGEAQEYEQKFGIDSDLLTPYLLRRIDSARIEEAIGALNQEQSIRGESQHRWKCIIELEILKRVSRGEDESNVRIEVYNRYSYEILEPRKEEEGIRALRNEVLYALLVTERGEKGLLPFYHFRHRVFVSFLTVSQTDILALDKVQYEEIVNELKHRWGYYGTSGEVLEIIFYLYVKIFSIDKVAAATTQAKQKCLDFIEGERADKILTLELYQEYVNILQRLSL